MSKLNEEQRVALLEEEPNILQGVLNAAQNIVETTLEIEIARNEQVFFNFKICPVTQAIYEKAQELSTKYTKNKRGYRVVDNYSQEDAQTRLIYQATHPDDRAKIWDNKELWAKLNVLTGHQVIAKVLLPGEISAVVNNIDDISGFSLDAEDVVLQEQEKRDELKN